MNETLNEPVEQTTPDTAWNPVVIWKAVPFVILLAVLYWRPMREMYLIWNYPDSYYSHGFLIAPVSLFLVWRKRKDLLACPVKPSALGYPLLLFASLLLVMSAFLGFSVFAHASLVFMLSGLILLLLGTQHFIILLFPTIFLFFMIPIPPSITQSVIFELKLLATSLAVALARLCTLPMIHDGSFVYFKEDYLLIGDVCGGLRSLISMLALGALMAYMSKAKLWAKFMTVLIAVPIAIGSNVIRIFFLCVVGYFWDSQTASGMVHDVSGFMMFILAFLLFIVLESSLRYIAPANGRKGEDA